MNMSSEPRSLPGLAETIGRHVEMRADATAFRFMARDGRVKREMTWRELHRTHSGRSFERNGERLLAGET